MKQVRIFRYIRVDLICHLMLTSAVLLAKQERHHWISFTQSHISQKWIWVNKMVIKIKSLHLLSQVIMICCLKRKDPKRNLLMDNLLLTEETRKVRVYTGLSNLVTRFFSISYSIFHSKKSFLFQSLTLVSQMLARPFYSNT